ncbi:MAG TPA: sulfur transferase domain-containing protein [Gemmatimonadales bacterium]|nr:sulfur transferase domain-containing protein [Gemmatimonadales bacterium]
MSQLLDAIAGVPNAAEPLPGLLTGGQPQAAHLAKLKQAGCEVVLDIRDPMEPRPIRVPEDVRAAGLDYINIPVGHSRGRDETLDRIREVLRGAAGKRKLLFHCASGNRSAAVLIPYLMLDQNFTEEDAVATAMRLGMRSAELMEWALDYVQKKNKN